MKNHGPHSRLPLTHADAYGRRAIRIVIGHLHTMISDCRWSEHSMYMNPACHIRLMINVHAASARITSKSLSIQLSFAGIELVHVLATLLFSLPYNLDLLPQPKKRGRGLHILYLSKRLGVILAWVLLFHKCNHCLRENIERASHVYFLGYFYQKLR